MCHGTQSTTQACAYLAIGQVNEYRDHPLATVFNAFRIAMVLGVEPVIVEVIVPVRLIVNDLRQARSFDTCTTLCRPACHESLYDACLLNKRIRYCPSGLGCTCIGSVQYGDILTSLEARSTTLRTTGSARSTRQDSDRRPFGPSSVPLLPTCEGTSRLLYNSAFH